MRRICRKNTGARPRDNAEIIGLVNKIRREIKPEKIFLFGSFARGDVHEKSDVDLIVLANFTEKFFDRIGRILDCNDTSFSLDVLAYTPQEFEKMRTQNNPLVARVLKEGIAL